MHGFLIFNLSILKNKIICIHSALLVLINKHLSAEGNQIFTEQTEVRIETCHIFSEKKENVLSSKN